jgi:hypothetical protein
MRSEKIRQFVVRHRFALTALFIAVCGRSDYHPSAPAEFWFRNDTTVEGPVTDLYGMVFGCDPGHGGADPGSHTNHPFTKEAVWEDEYVHDVCRRAQAYVRGIRGESLLSVTDTVQKQPDNRPPSEVILGDRNELFTLTGHRVVAGTKGLLERVRTCNSLLDEFPEHRIVCLAVHFDATGNGELSGVHFVAPTSHVPEIVTALEIEFRAAHRLRKNGDEGEYYPVGRSGDASHGIRNLFFLRGREDAYRGEYNRVCQRALIELGNFTNPQDRWRIRDPKVRQEFAEIIGRALLRVNSLPWTLAREC